MKRLMLLFGVLLFAAGCGPPDPEDIYYSTVWSVRNSTDDALQITPPYGKNAPYYLASEASVVFYSRGENYYEPWFDNVLVCWRDVPEDQIAFSVSSEGGVLLKEWKFSDVMTNNKGYYPYLEGKHFFRGETWIQTDNNDRRKKKEMKWTFEILPEDLTAQSE